MPYLSLIVPTMRVGGLDVLFDSLRRQTFTDFELILVDGLARRRAGLIDEAARDRFLAVTAVEPTPNPFPLCAFCHYANAGMAVARGEVAVFMVDYTRLAPDTLEAHARFHKEDETGHKGLMMPHRYVDLDLDPAFPHYGQSDIDRYAEDLRTDKLDVFMWSIGKASEQPSRSWVVDQGTVAKADADPKLRLPPGPVSPDHFHAKNESVRLDRCIEAGGFDLDLDGTHGYQDTDFAERLTAKAGVQWYVDPAHPVDIVNPRPYFPFAKRVRQFADNERIWRDKRSKGYPQVNPSRPLAEVRKAQQAAMQEQIKAAAGEAWDTAEKLYETYDKTGAAGRRRLTIAMIYGEFSSAIHGPFDLPGLYTKSGLTGSESSFFNLARTLAERGHRVVVFCKCEMPYEHPSGMACLPLPMLRGIGQIPDLDVAIAWNEPDYLRLVPPGIPRIVDQQLNDWNYCQPKWEDVVDHIVFPSQHSQAHHVNDEGLQKARTGSVIPNSVDLGLFAGAPPERANHRVVWASSPDRGLHHLLSLWPALRQRVPDAELRVFYRLGPWLQHNRGLQDETGKRARYVEMAIAGLKNHGVTAYDSVPNLQMAQEFRSAKVLAYPCDPIRYTEGFGCSVLDAAAGGCIPVISDADALPQVHKKAAVVIAGKPDGERQRTAWLECLTHALLEPVPEDWKKAMGMHAEEHSRERVTDQWEALLYSKVR